MDATSGAATASSSSDVLPDTEQNENSDDQESGDESQENATLPRKRKKYTCVFRKEYAKLFSWATESKKGPTYAFCMKCIRNTLDFLCLCRWLIVHGDDTRRRKRPTGTETKM